LAERRERESDKQQRTDSENRSRKEKSHRETGAYSLETPVKTVTFAKMNIQIMFKNINNFKSSKKEK